MRGFRAMGQMMFQRIHHRDGRRVLAHGQRHNTCEVLFPLFANTDPQRDSIFIPQSRSLADVVAAHPLITREVGVKAGVEKLFKPRQL